MRTHTNVLPHISPQYELDRITRLTRELLRTPYACAWVSDRENRLAVSGAGIPALVAIVLSYPLSRHMVSSGKLFAVGDGRALAFAARSAAVRDGTVTAYAGIPVTGRDGRGIGALFVMDRSPRSWKSTELKRLESMSRMLAQRICAREMSVIAPRLREFAAAP